MKTRIIDTIIEYNMLSTKDTVVVGVSGGADSVCLLFLLCSIASQYELNLEVVHVNHNLRETAKNDAEFVEKLCCEFEERFGINIPFSLVNADIPKIAKEEGLSCEEAGRKVRYSAMRELLGNRKGCIAVAHHANDRAETMLFNLFRGSGIRGLGGIRPVSGDIIRPLIDVTRNEIEDYLSKEGLSFVMDETNLTDEYTRNKIRHNIMEYAEKEICRGTVRNMSRTASMLTEADEFLNKCTDEAMKRCLVFETDGERDLSVSALLNEDKYIRSRILFNTVCLVAGRSKDIGFEHQRAIEAILGTHGSQKTDLPYGVEAVREYNIIKIRKKGQSNPAKELPEMQVSMNILEKFNKSDIPSDAYTKWFDYDKISTVAKVRFREEGDYLCVNSKMQRKPLKEYLINEKVPKELRDSISLLADGNHIMWVIGMRISEYYKVTDETRRVLEVHYGRES